MCFWLSMRHDIDNHVSNCSVCNSTEPHQPKEPMKSHPLPTLPWQTVGVDLFEWNDLYYMAIGDLYSGWFDMASLNDQSVRTVIQKLKHQFCTHSTPATVITDNARQFDCQAFSDFAKCWDFQHIISSDPYYQQSNMASRSPLLSVQSNSWKRPSKTTRTCTRTYLMLATFPLIRSLDNHATLNVTQTAHSDSYLWLPIETIRQHAGYAPVGKKAQATAANII